LTNAGSRDKNRWTRGSELESTAYRKITGRESHVERKKPNPRQATQNIFASPASNSKLSKKGRGGYGPPKGTKEKGVPLAKKKERKDVTGCIHEK